MNLRAHLTDERGHVKLLSRERLPTEAREGQQIVDQLRHLVRARANHIEYAPAFFVQLPGVILDRKSTRLNSSHSQISYAVFCLKKKNTKKKKTFKLTSTGFHKTVSRECSSLLYYRLRLRSFYSGLLLLNFSYHFSCTLCRFRLF